MGKNRSSRKDCQAVSASPPEPLPTFTARGAEALRGWWRLHGWALTPSHAWEAVRVGFLPESFALKVRLFHAG